ncbi:MAG: hypothetical protein BWY99_00383 [Synergistetes bacterium ADurb.BinA166]|nr:MAG: hypothetical protein BWY99_00383 [Synergistetes bacterium ADurb.BinA166]
MIQFSQKLTEAILARWKGEGVRFTSRLLQETVPDRALFVRASKRERPGVIVGMSAWASRFGTQTEASAAHTETGTIVFLCSEEKALQIVQAIGVPDRKAPPEKVAVKMVLLRLQALKAEIDDHNARVAKAVECPNGYQPPRGLQTPIPAIPPELPGKVALRDWLKAAPGLGIGSKRDTMARRKLLDLEKVLDRADITDEAVTTAVRCLAVGGVMTE